MAASLLYKEWKEKNYITKYLYFQVIEINLARLCGVLYFHNIMNFKFLLARTLTL